MIKRQSFIKKTALPYTYIKGVIVMDLYVFIYIIALPT